MKKNTAIITIALTMILVIGPEFSPRLSWRLRQAHAAVGTVDIQGSTASFSGIITTASNQFIQPAFGPVVLKYKSGLDTYTDGIVMRPGDGNVGIGMTAGTNIPSKLTVAGTVELTSGSIKFPDATSQSTAGSSVPASTIMPFNLAACPSGWTEVTGARGFTIVGLPASGTLAGTVGTALTNLEDRTHTHTGPSHTHTYTDVVAHTHAVDPPATTSTTNSVAHTHAVDPPITTSSNPGTHTHSAAVNNLANGSTRGWGTDASGTTTQITGSDGAHSHTVDIASFTSGSESTTHTHSVDVASFTSGSTGIATGTTAASGTGATGTAATSNVIPYIQLIICQKS